MVSKSFSSLVLTLGVVAPLAGAFASTACSSKFEGCASSRSCPSDAGEGGGGGTGGNVAGRGGSAATGGAAATSGSGGSLGGDAGEAGASSGKGGRGGTGGTGSAAEGGSAGSTDSKGGEGGRDTALEPDEAPPEILSVSPADGETGVHADAVIRITFSEPMDRVTAENAYQSADIPAAMTTVRWNSDDTVLTITPNSELTYVEGMKDDLSFAAKEYALEMTDTAEDKAGNRLVHQEWSFTTLRHFDQVLTADGADVRRFHDEINDVCDNAMYLGDDDSDSTLAGFVQFDLSELAPGATEFDYAHLYGERMDGAGVPRYPFTGVPGSQLTS